MERELFPNGLPDLLILRLLARREMYGYEMVAQISLLSQNVLSFGEGCIYPILHRLVSEKLVAQRSAKVNGRIRRYYHLSASGRKHLAIREKRWADVTNAVAKFAE